MPHDPGLDKAGESSRVRIGILGTPVSSGNRGVQALATSLVSLCFRAGARDVVLFVGHREPGEVAFRVGDELRSVRVVNYRLSPRARPCEHLAWILAASLLYRTLPWRPLRRWLSRRTPWIAALDEVVLAGDICGGDSFSDIYGWRRFLVGFAAAWTVVCVKRGLMQFPQTFGPYERGWVRRLARWLLRRAPVVVARDRESQEVAQSLVGNTRRVLLSPDVAFALEARRPARIELDPPIAGNASNGGTSVPPIGVNVNGLMYNGGYTRANMFGLKLDYAGFLPSLVTALLREHEGDLWLVPHTYGPPESVESDPEACRRMRAALPTDVQARVRIVTGEYDCHEIKGVIGLCDFFVGSRMHACIAALSQGVPTVGVAYSRKFEGVFESVGVRDWVVDARRVDHDEALAKVIELYRRRNEVRARLRRQAEMAKVRLQEVFRELISRTMRSVSAGANG
jgi:polysaccharide pyruvyl transferase WcaK-like protein